MTDAPKCRQCEKRLKPYYETRDVKYETPSLIDDPGFETLSERTGQILGYGYGRRGLFCSLRCGWRFAIDAIEHAEGITRAEGTPGAPLTHLREPLSDLGPVTDKASREWVALYRLTPRMARLLLAIASRVAPQVVARVDLEELHAVCRELAPLAVHLFEKSKEVKP